MLCIFTGSFPFLKLMRKVMLLRFKLLKNLFIKANNALITTDKKGQHVNVTYPSYHLKDGRKQ